jgi:rod shape determining protein RodA
MIGTLVAPGASTRPPSVLRGIDWKMMIIAMVLCVIGVVQIYSSTRGTNLASLWWKQIICIFIGLIVFWIFTEVEYRTLLGQAPVMYLIIIGLLIVTFLVGSTVFGSRRWIPMPLGFRLQPSELCKVVVVLLAARFLSELTEDKLSPRNLLRLCALIGVPFLLVNRQPDLGTSLTYLPPLFTGAYLAGMRWQHAAAIVLAIVLLVPTAWFLLKPYQKDRIMTFLDPDSDPQGKGYHVRQSMIAVGSGGMWGQGVTRGLQTQLRFLPVAHTDFIFANFAEEQGFAGVVVALWLYWMLIQQILQNSLSAPDRAGKYICLGVAGVILLHILINVGMMIGKVPVTGIPLPLLSYGGSGMISTFALLGLVNNVRLRRIF